MFCENCGKQFKKEQKFCESCGKNNNQNAKDDDFKRCPFCKNGCSVCKKTTWLEIFPGGLIHPNVLKSGGINPEKYSGFAFGFGLTRLAMLKYNINDIRLFHGGKIKFLEQF